jgi:GGDEF domain-containing protein
VNDKLGRRAVISFLDITREQQYERLLARELDLEAAPDDISPQNLIGIVATLLQKAGPDNSVSIGMAALEGLDEPGIRGSMTQDEALRRFVEITRQCTRRQDIIGRCENASFIFMFPGAGIHMAAAISRRIHDTMAAVFAAYGAFGISFSAGFMELKAPQLAHTTGSEIIRTVESCLQTARHRGGSLFVSGEVTARLKD